MHRILNTTTKRCFFIYLSFLTFQKKEETVTCQQQFSIRQDSQIVNQLRLPIPFHWNGPVFIIYFVIFRLAHICKLALVLLVKFFKVRKYLNSNFDKQIKFQRIQLIIFQFLMAHRDYWDENQFTNVVKSLLLDKKDAFFNDYGKQKNVVSSQSSLIPLSKKVKIRKDYKKNRIKPIGKSQVISIVDLDQEQIQYYKQKLNIVSSKKQQTKTSSQILKIQEVKHIIPRDEIKKAKFIHEFPPYPLDPADIWPPKYPNSWRAFKEQMKDTRKLD